MNRHMIWLAYFLSGVVMLCVFFITRLSLECHAQNEEIKVQHARAEQAIKTLRQYEEARIDAAWEAALYHPQKPHDFRRGFYGK